MLPTVVVSTVPVDVTVSPPSAVAPASVYVDPFSTVAGLCPFIVISGAVVSTTLTVLVAVPVFLLHLLLYMLWYMSQQYLVSQYLLMLPFHHHQQMHLHQYS